MGRAKGALLEIKCLQNPFYFYGCLISAPNINIQTENKEGKGQGSRFERKAKGFLLYPLLHLSPVNVTQ